jgi:hypothetical protein
MCFFVIFKFLSLGNLFLTQKFLLLVIESLHVRLVRFTQIVETGFIHIIKQSRQFGMKLRVLWTCGLSGYSECNSQYFHTAVECLNSSFILDDVGNHLHGWYPRAQKARNTKLSATVIYSGQVFPTILVFHRIMTGPDTSLIHWLKSTGMSRSIPSFMALKLSTNAGFVSL